MNTITMSAGLAGILVVGLAAAPGRAQMPQSLGSSSAIQQLQSQIQTDPYRNRNRAMVLTPLPQKDQPDLIEVDGLPRPATPVDARADAIVEEPDAPRTAPAVRTGAMPPQLAPSPAPAPGPGRLSPSMRALLSKTRALKELRARQDGAGR